MYVVVGGVVAPPPSVVDDVGMSDVLLRWRWLIGLLWRCCRAITVVNEGGERIGGGVRARKLLLLLGLLPLLVIYFLMIQYRERRLLMPVIRDKLDEGYDTYDDFEEVVRDAERQGHGWNSPVRCHCGGRETRTSRIEAPDDDDDDDDNDEEDFGDTASNDSDADEDQLTDSILSKWRRACSFVF
jgi:hypothetical protein